MNLSSTAQAMMLLTCHFGKADSKSCKPLTNAEWGRFALWLKDEGISPSDLLESDSKNLLTDWSDSRVSVDRLLALLGRGHSLALAMEKWDRAGLWVVTRSDPEYPRQLKRRLQKKSPPVLFGCGDKSLLNGGGIAVVGSRDAEDSDLLFAEQLGAKAASEGIAIVSGGARGVDEAAMQGTVQTGGSTVGVLADSLLKTATSYKWREGIMDGRAALVSPFNPEAGFNTGNAMARNKYIYCLADVSLVVHSGKTGGTYAGAVENLKNGWVPLFVKPSQDQNIANDELVCQGGRRCDAKVQFVNLSELFVSSPKRNDMPSKKQTDMFQKEKDRRVRAERVYPLGVNEKSTSRYTEQGDDQVDFYQVFVKQLAKLAKSPIRPDDLVKKTKLHKSQVKDWLKQAVDEKYIEKLIRPVRYRYVPKRDEK
ncbi:MAG: DNA-processing protein DprA [Pseudohongiellaceae bacterium]